MTPTASDPNPPRLAYRLGELATALGISRWTLRRIIDRGELSISQVGSITVITADEVRRFLARHETRMSATALGTVEGSVAKGVEVPASTPDMVEAAGAPSLRGSDPSIF